MDTKSEEGAKAAPSLSTDTSHGKVNEERIAELEVEVLLLQTENHKLQNEVNYWKSRWETERWERTKALHGLPDLTAAAPIRVRFSYLDSSNQKRVSSDGELPMPSASPAAPTTPMKSPSPLKSRKPGRIGATVGRSSVSSEALKDGALLILLSDSARIIYLVKYFDLKARFNTRIWIDGSKRDSHRFISKDLHQVSSALASVAAEASLDCKVKVSSSPVSANGKLKATAGASTSTKKAAMAGSPFETEATAVELDASVQSMLMLWFDIVNWASFVGTPYALQGAMAIVKRYLRPSSKHPVQLPAELHEALSKELHQGPTPALFKGIQDLLISKLESTMYRAYTSSPAKHPHGFSAGLLASEVVNSLHTAHRLVSEELAARRRAVPVQDEADLDAVLNSPLARPALRSFLERMEEIEEKTAAPAPAAPATATATVTATADSSASASASVVVVGHARIRPLQRYLFVLEANEFKQCPQSEYRITWARKLYERFFSEGSSFGVPEYIKASLLRAMAHQPSSAIFEPAKQHCITLLLKHYWAAFTVSKEFQELLANLRSLTGKTAPSQAAAAASASADSASGAESQETARASSPSRVLAAAPAPAPASAAASASTSASAVGISGSSGAGAGAGASSVPVATTASSELLRELLPTPVDSFPTFDDVLSDLGLVFFRRFLETEEKHAAQLVAFYMELQEFKRCPPSKSGTDLLRRYMIKFYDSFVKMGANRQVPLTESARNSVVASFQNPSPFMFQRAEEEVLALLRDELYPLFLLSEECGRLREVRESLDEHERTKMPSTSPIRRHSMMVLSNPSSSQHVAALSQVAVAFDAILQDSQTLAAFKHFLQRNFAAESLLFYMEVQQYKRTPQGDFLQSLARKLYAKFIKPRANMCITYLTPELRERIGLGIESSKSAPSLGVFNEAESLVYQFLSRQKYLEFLRSPEYEELLKPQDIRVNEDGSAAVKPPSEAQMAKERAAEEHKATELIRRGQVDAAIDEKETPSFQEVLKIPLCRLRFSNFLVRSLCNENLMFYLACEEFRYIPSKDYLRVRAHKIYQTFVSENAKQQVNLPSFLRRELQTNLSNPTNKLFVDAQKSIFKLMEADLYPRFLKSPEFAAYVAERQVLRESRRRGSLFGCLAQPVSPTMPSTAAPAPATQAKKQTVKSLSFESR